MLKASHFQPIKPFLSPHYMLGCIYYLSIFCRVELTRWDCLNLLCNTPYKSRRDMPWHVRFQQHPQIRLIGGHATACPYIFTIHYITNQRLTSNRTRRVHASLRKVP